MQQSDDVARGALEAVAREINELERLCVELDRGLATRDWARMDQAITDSRRAMHAFEETMAEAAPFRDERFDGAVFVRMQQIYAYRDERLQNLREIHEEIGARLRQLSRWKDYAKSIGGAESRRGISAIDGLR